MRVLITWGSKLGGTEGIARILGEELQRRGFAVLLAPAAEVHDLRGIDAVIVGGGLYANRWQADARRFVARSLAELRRVPVWFFSSGPLDDSADRQEIPPSHQVGDLLERVGGLGHVTFGGRLAPDARGFPAAAMAKQHSGDFRNPERIRAWAGELAAVIPDARPGVAVDPPARALPRLLTHGLVGSAACAGLLALLLQVTGAGTALLLHALAAPLIFALIAVHYFRPRGARTPLRTALAFAATFALFQLALVAGPLQGGVTLLRSMSGFWIPLVTIFAVTWAVGGIRSTMPWPKPSPPSRPAVV